MHPVARNYDKKPLLLFWEMTRACPLACAHCRACAQLTGLPGELTTDEAKRFLDIYYTLDYDPKFIECWVAAGSPDECVRHLRAYKELGFDEVTLRIAGWDQFGQLKRVMEEVLPRV